MGVFGLGYAYIPILFASVRNAMKREMVRDVFAKVVCAKCAQAVDREEDGLYGLQ
jgi:hypothetical protein